MRSHGSFFIAAAGVVPVAAAAAALALAIACGGGDGSPTTPVTTTPTTTLPPPSVVLQNSYPIPAYYIYGEYFTTSRTGTIDATIDYTYATNQIVVWIARGSCTADLFVANQCDYAATSFAGSKPRKVSVTGATAGTFTLLMGNFGPEDDSVSYQVVLTPTASAGGPGATIRALPGSYLVRLPQP
jgi:hypothetical protein